MKYRDILRFSLRGIRRSPLRSLLSALSVAVGTGALLVIASLGLFGRRQVENGLALIGVSGLAVSTDENASGAPLSAALTERMAQAVPGIAAASPVRADENLGEVMQLELLAGALPSRAQVKAGAAVAVVGDDLAQRLYGRTNITGREVRVTLGGAERVFTVCGVIKAQTSALGGMLSAVAPDLVYLPYGLLASESERADQVFVACSSSADPDAVGRSISSYLTTRGQVAGTAPVLRYRRHRAFRVASRRVQQYAVRGARAHERNRHSPRPRRTEARHPADFPHRVGASLRRGRRFRSIERVGRTESRSVPSAAGMASDGGAAAPCGGLRRRGRTAPGGACVPYEPHRGDAAVKRLTAPPEWRPRPFSRGQGSSCASALRPPPARA